MLCVNDGAVVVLGVVRARGHVVCAKWGRAECLYVRARAGMITVSVFCFSLFGYIDH